ncbi:serine hydrolase [Gangjinia marincola]|uniref:Serine hydrolase n=1 Tax=Gangjinia marincola TaxID=578463 RepID=A0ABP3XS40_9FLAO
MKLPLTITIFTLFFCLSCSTTDDGTPETKPQESGLYFPPTTGNNWETLSLETLGWNEAHEQPLYYFLAEKNTKAFLILKDGKIVLEWYDENSNENSFFRWFSAGKTLTATMIGIAQTENFIDISAPTSTYLGEGWTSMNEDLEQQITVRNQLTMTTGLDYTGNLFCTDSDCLTYLNEPNSFWYYHNAPYSLLSDVLTNATGMDFSIYFNMKVTDPIGMDGYWESLGYNNFFVSPARSMARFGLLMLNQGTWNENVILSDQAYYEQMFSSSQDLNKSYGYLWWLNGKESFHVPGSTQEFSGSLIPSAPADLVAGLGANDQKLYLVPSQNLVIIRMGDDAGDPQLGPSAFDELLWQELNTLMN